MKILQVNCVYNNGSTGKIVYDIHRGLQEHGIRSVVCYGRGQKVFEPNVYKTSTEINAKLNALKSRITGLQYNGSWFATNKLENIINKEQPDIVHLHCINGYFVNIYRLFWFLKKNNIKTVLTLHAEFIYTGSCGHAYECNKWLTGCGNCPQLWIATKSFLFDRTHSAWVQMKNAIDGFDCLRIVSVSQWLQNRAQQSPIIYGKKFQVVENGVETKSTFRPSNFQSLKDKHSLTGETILLHVTSSFSLRKDNIKGGWYIVKLAERLKKENLKIIVIGGRSSQKRSLPDNIIRLNRTSNQKELARYYSMADLTVLTSKRETFSMPCAESLACGTPVVGFKAGGLETIALKDYSELVEYGDINALEQAVRKWLKKKETVANELIRIASQHYSKERMCERYISIYKELKEQ